MKHYLSLMFAQGARIAHGDAVAEHHRLLQSEVDAYGSVLLTACFGVGTSVFLFGYLHVERGEEPLAVLRDFHAKDFAAEAQMLEHLHVAKVGNVHVLTLAADVVGGLLQVLQSLVRVGETYRVVAKIEVALAVLLPVRLWIVGTMLEEIGVGFLQIVEGMSRGVLRYLVGERELLSTDDVEVVAQLAPAQSTLALFVPPLPFSQPPVVGQTAAAYRLAEIGLLLVVRHQLDAVGDGNHTQTINDCITGCQGSSMQRPLRWLSHTSPDAVGVSSKSADIKIAACDAALLTALMILTLQRYKQYLKTCKTATIFYEIL